MVFFFIFLSSFLNFFMLAIRLARVGKKNYPYFRVVLMDKRRSPKGRALEILGSLNPRNKEVALKKERILYWISVGAQPSERIHNLLISKGVITGKKIKKKIRIKKKEEEQADSAQTVELKTEEKDHKTVAKEAEVKNEEPVSSDKIEEPIKGEKEENEKILKPASPAAGGQVQDDMIPASAEATAGKKDDSRKPKKNDKKESKEKKPETKKEEKEKISKDEKSPKEKLEDSQKEKVEKE